MSSEDERVVAAAAQRHGLGEGATRALWQALVAGHGSQAQFSHPDLGGMGQWSGGMVQIGDMFNTALKAKVAAACADLAQAAGAAGAARSRQSPSQDGDLADGGSAPAAAAAVSPRIGEDVWWPEHLGRPSSTGAQNDSRYAVFPRRRRLAVRRSGKVTVYDTGEHLISGFSQQQGTGSALALTSQSGPVMLDSLRVIDQEEWP